MMKKLSIFLSTILIIRLFNCNDIFALETKVSQKKGAGFTVMHYVQNTSGYWYPDSSLYCEYVSDPITCWNRLKEGINSLGVTWMYDWNNWDSGWQVAQRLGIEYVPLVTTPSENDMPHLMDVARKHPGSYWLVFNEPDLKGSFISFSNAAGYYKRIYDNIKQADPTVKFIVGGMLYDGNWSGWARDFREEYKTRYGSYPIVNGWHGHYYHCSDYSSSSFRNVINYFRDKINAWGGRRILVNRVRLSNISVSTNNF